MMSLIKEDIEAPIYASTPLPPLRHPYDTLISDIKNFCVTIIISNMWTVWNMSTGLLTKVNILMSNISVMYNLTTRL